MSESKTVLLNFNLRTLFSKKFVHLNLNCLLFISQVLLMLRLFPEDIKKFLLIVF